MQKVNEKQNQNSQLWSPPEDHKKRGHDEYKVEIHRERFLQFTCYGPGADGRPEMWRRRTIGIPQGPFDRD
jgi:hypothetical protein